MNHHVSSEPGLTPPVIVRRHRVDWEASADLDDVTFLRVRELALRITLGCWFLNPRFTVSSRAPTAEFFRKVIELRSAWLRTCRQVLGRSGQQRLAREAERRGRRGALLVLDPTITGGAADYQHPTLAGLSNLPRESQQSVIEAGHLSRGLAYGGVLFIDGNLLAPRTWQAMADELLAPERSSRRSNRRRRADPSIRPTVDPGPRSGSANLPQPPTGGA